MAVTSTPWRRMTLRQSKCPLEAARWKLQREIEIEREREKERESGRERENYSNILLQEMVVRAHETVRQEKVE